jgi:hypothetical protein
VLETVQRPRDQPARARQQRLGASSGSRRHLRVQGGGGSTGGGSSSVMSTAAPELLAAVRRLTA